MTRRIADDFAAIAARLKGIEPDPTSGAFGKIEITEPECEACEDVGWVQAYSPRPPAFDVCPKCFNPNGRHSP